MVDSFRSVAANVSQLKLCGKTVDSSQIKTEIKRCRMSEGG